uniref:Chromosome 14 open reading frame 119 n=1 Tax=Eptatretus burgeri TaxID=7764 RepID=A0A8C4Q359_EPTBU
MHGIAVQHSLTEYVSFVAMQQARCIVHWFTGWNTAQRERFLRDLVAKAFPGQPCSLLDGLSSLGVADHPPSIFECQLRLWTQWFDEWSEDERSSFMVALSQGIGWGTWDKQDGHFRGFHERNQGN